MVRGRRAVRTTALVVVLVTAAYGTADAYDIVPGLVTLSPAPAPARPFPQAPGAVTGPAVVAPLASLGTVAAVPDATRVAALVQGLVADSRLGGSVGVLVTDQSTGTVVASHEADVPRTPASTAKLATATAALSRLGPERTLPTRVVRDGTDGIVLVGGGDMMLAAGAGDPTAVNGRAGLSDLATQVATALTLAGSTTVRLVYDDHLFTGAAVNPGWQPGDVSGGYVAPVTALGVNVGRTKPDSDAPRSATPAADAATAFTAALAAHGITVRGGPVRGTAAADALQLGSVSSAPIGEIVDYFLHESDNTIAEVVGRLVALDAGLPATFEGAAAAVLAELRGVGVDVGGSHLVDASGLADGSTATPTLLVGLIRTVTDATRPKLRAVAVDLPVAGLSGTLADRFTTSAARGLVRAKTGSLTGVTTLAGTVQDADGRLLAFAVMADATGATGQRGPRAAVDDFITKLAACGCRAG